MLKRNKLFLCAACILLVIFFICLIIVQLQNADRPKPDPQKIYQAIKQSASITAEYNGKTTSLNQEEISTFKEMITGMLDKKNFPSIAMNEDHIKTNLKFTLDSDYYVYVAESKDLLFLFRLDMQQYAISLTEDQYQIILSFTEE